MEDNYLQLIELISEKSGISKEDIQRRIEAKQAKLAGLISKAGAAQIIAAELNISFDRQTIKISQIVPGMRKINLIGKIINLFPVREYNKNGRSGRIGSFILADNTSNVRIVMWDENHIDLISQGKIGHNDVVEINNATLRNGEIHLTSFSEIKISNQIVKDVILDKPLIKKEIIKFDVNEKVSTRAFIVQIFEPKFFKVCIECGKKVSELDECLTHGKVVPEKRVLLNFVVDDGSDSIRTLIFSDQIEKLMPKADLENPEKFSIKKKELLGKEMIISGQVRKNALYNNQEFIISDLQEIDVDKLIVELEGN
jgi:replication factor A1